MTEEACIDWKSENGLRKTSEGWICLCNTSYKWINSTKARNNLERKWVAVA